MRRTRQSLEVFPSQGDPGTENVCVARYVQNQNLLEAGDMEEALRAASAVGDDQIQRRTTGYVVPDSFTHGTSEQRLRWFRKGYETGDIRQGDTFNTPNL